jgi:hypothetical protein
MMVNLAGQLDWIKKCLKTSDVSGRGFPETSDMGEIN